MFSIFTFYQRFRIRRIRIILVIIIFTMLIHVSIHDNQNCENFKTGFYGKLNPRLSLTANEKNMYVNVLKKKQKKNENIPTTPATIVVHAGTNQQQER